MDTPVRMWEQERDGGTSSHSQENKGDKGQEDRWVGDKKEGKKSKMRKENRKNR